MPGCGRPHSARGWCKEHYGRWYRTGDPTFPAKVTVCTVEDCDAEPKAQGLCTKHLTRWKRHGDVGYFERIIGDPVARFWSKVDKAGECWLWTATINASGYGSVGIGQQTFLAHRVSYEWERGPIPGGMEVDHLCSVRACVRPDHLEVVTQAQNKRRAADRITHCKRGHPFTPENIYTSPAGYRTCRTCKAMKMSEWYRAHKGRG